MYNAYMTTLTILVIYSILGLVGVWLTCPENVEEASPLYKLALVVLGGPVVWLLFLVNVYFALVKNFKKR